MAGLPALISSDRIRLFLISPEEAADMVAGRRHDDRWHPDYPRKDDVDAASMIRAGGDGADGADGATWGPRHIVLDRLAVGSIGCFGPPVDGETEVGYGLVPDARGRGVATEALGLLAAEADKVGVRLRASVAPDNTSSLRVLAKCGFSDLRGTTEDGELVMVRRPRPAS
ncbi:RimJ/RimL family protein N-acetyltransferase [Nocardioides thalensis]|uniref:RimJ/RimL family protein N-acetyltransferase n=1 Tax=Nocardioides thalensis TaxID=1914755 RepID=A0A853C6A1_9ACTN|nr:GNAT family N-acetyltransferase [Nocardioides thalensis]NYJ03375.1 RimJ/RimL family protein N-acetyltransferase [Nocardioides thalensis]